MLFEYLRFNIVCILYTYIMRKYVNIDKWHTFGIEVGVLYKLQFWQFYWQELLSERKTFSEFKVIYNAACPLKKFIMTISQSARSVSNN